MAELDKVARALGEPVIDELPEYVQKLRRNLMISSTFALVYFFGSIKVERTAPLGIEISGLSETVIDVALLSVVFYNLVHFIWHCIDYVGIWRMHLTGTRLNYQTGSKWGSDDADYPDDPRQSNLYTWWREKAVSIGNLSQTAKILEETASQLRDTAGKHEPLSSGLPAAFLSEQAANITKQASELRRRLGEVEKALSSNRPSVSLERFDRWFRLFKTSQIVRLFLLELGLPCILAIVVLIAICMRLTFSALC